MMAPRVPRPRSAAGVPALPGVPSSGSTQALAADLPSEVPRARQTGTTIAGVEALEKNGFRFAAMSAVAAANARADDMSK